MNVMGTEEKPPAPQKELSNPTGSGVEPQMRGVRRIVHTSKADFCTVIWM